MLCWRCTREIKLKKMSQQKSSLLKWFIEVKIALWTGHIIMVKWWRVRINPCVWTGPAVFCVFCVFMISIRTCCCCYMCIFIICCLVCINLSSVPFFVISIVSFCPLTPPRTPSLLWPPPSSQKKGEGGEEEEVAVEVMCLPASGCALELYTPELHYRHRPIEAPVSPPPPKKCI